MLLFAFAVSLVTGAAFAWVSRSDAGLTAILVSGPLMGIGVAAMHYTGMAALRMSGSAAYKPAIVAASVAIAVTAATAALWLTFRQHGIWQKLIAAVVMGIAVAGMHYTGMAAAGMGGDHRPILRRIPGIWVGKRRPPRRRAAYDRCMECHAA